MKRHIFLITLLAVLTGRIAAQSVTVDATIDSLQILIGEQAKIKLQVALDADKACYFSRLCRYFGAWSGNNRYSQAGYANAE